MHHELTHSSNELVCESNGGEGGGDGGGGGGGGGGGKMAR